MEKYFNEIGELIHLGDAPPTIIAVRLINVALSFLGIVFVAIIIYTGFLFLFSLGKAERLVAAKRSFFNALIGLLIILSAYSIVQFVMEAFGETTQTNGNTLREESPLEEQTP